MKPFKDTMAYEYISMSTSSSATSSPEIFTGRVKWFNNKTGFGFITITDGVKSGTDVFVHHSAVKVDAEQYRYLVQGEYVELSLVPTTGGEYEFQAGNVSGIKGGKLMCETRNEYRSVRSSYVKDSTTGPVRAPRSVRVRGEGPREEPREGWSYVAKAKTTSSPDEEQFRKTSAPVKKQAGRPKKSVPVSEP